MTSSEKNIEVYVDGGSRGNPGPAGGGYAIMSGGKVVTKGSKFFGKKTNNQAEYMALIAALEAVEKTFSDFTVNCFMDSQLVVEQMNGNYKVKSENVKPLFAEVKKISEKLPSFSISHIPREENFLADNLANQAMDRGY